MKRKMNGAVILAMIGVAITLGSFAVLRLRPPSLLRQATRIADTRQWDRVERAENRAFYRWISDHELLFFRVDGRGGAVPVRRDIRTDTETVIEDYNPFRLILPSPDGKWRLEQKLGAPQFRTSAADGSGGTLWDGPKEMSPSDTFWLPDSRGWVKVRRWGQLPFRRFRESEVLLYRLDTTGAAERVKKRPPTQTIRQPDPDAEGASPPPWLLGLTPAPTGAATGVAILPANPPAHRPGSTLRHLQYTSGFGGEHGGMASFRNDSFDYIEWDFLIANGKIRRRPFQSPPGIRRAFVALSPRGDRLAWMAQSRNVLPPLEWLHTRFPFLPIPVTPITTLWVTKPDGTQPRLLASEKARPGDVPPGPVRWTPDGRRISFLYKNTLWAVPVD